MATKTKSTKPKTSVAADAINTILKSNANFEFEPFEDLLSQVAIYKLRYTGVVPQGNSGHVAFLDLNDLVKIKNYLDIIIKEAQCL